MFTAYEQTSNAFGTRTGRRECSGIVSTWNWRSPRCVVFSAKLTSTRHETEAMRAMLQAGDTALENVDTAAKGVYQALDIRASVNQRWCPAAGRNSQPSASAVFGSDEKLTVDASQRVPELKQAVEAMSQQVEGMQRRVIRLTGLRATSREVSAMIEEDRISTAAMLQAAQNAAASMAAASLSTGARVDSLRAEVVNADRATANATRRLAALNTQLEATAAEHKLQLSNTATRAAAYKVAICVLAAKLRAQVPSTPGCDSDHTPALTSSFAAGAQGVKSNRAQRESTNLHKSRATLETACTSATKQLRLVANELADTVAKVRRLLTAPRCARLTLATVAPHCCTAGCHGDRPTAEGRAKRNSYRRARITARYTRGGSTRCCSCFAAPTGASIHGSMRPRASRACARGYALDHT